MHSEGEAGSPSVRRRTQASQSQFTARCFVPETLIDYINNTVGAGQLKPASFFLHGVCLLVDISGFTKLSSAFCAQGKNGIDGLQLATNGFMGKLVEIIYSYGGDIIKFAGDAIICIFYSKKRLKESFRPNNASPVRDPTILKIDSNSDKSLPDSVIMPPSQLALIQIPSSSGGHKYDIDNSTEDTDLLADKSDRQSSVLASVSEIQPEIVLKAIRCALELRDVETQKLTVHVAMSCGKICFGILGGYVNRWECLISGQCIHQLSECLDDAPSKHAALTAECFEVLNVHSQKKNRKTKPRAGGGGGGDEDFRPENYDYLSQVQLQRLRSGNYMIISAESTDGFGTEYLSETPRSTPLPALVSQFVPVPISSGLEYTTGLSYLAEIREVTTMFMKWESYDATGRHRDLMRLQSYFLQVQRILHSTGAFLRQFLVDDKGCVLIACWGMPSLSYLDNSHRALSAAAQIRAKLVKMEMKCSFGITTGDVYCGTVGSALRMEYAAIGSVVNMSARLMGKAEEGILIDRETYVRLPDSVLPSLEELEPIMVKGREEPLAVYRYSGEGSILIGDDVVEDHEVREVCKVTFIKLLDNMKAPGRFSVFRRRQSVAKVKEWLSESFKRGGDLLTQQHMSVKDASSSARGGGLLRSSFQSSFRNSFRMSITSVASGGNGDSNKSGLGGNDLSTRSAVLQAQQRLTSPRSSRLSNKDGVDGNSNRISGGSSVSPIVRRGSISQSVGARGQYQHDDGDYRHIHEIPYVLMEGRRGAGKSSIVNWLKKQASDRSIPVYRARMSRDDMMVDYSVWLKVFKQHMPKDMYKSEENQCRYLTPLLNTVYPDDADAIEHVVMPSLRHALNITCEIELEKDDSGFGGDLVKPTKMTRQKVTPRVVIETLLKIFAHLLNEKPELLIIENIQYADEESLNVLLGLTHLHTLSAVVLTGLGPDSLSAKKGNGVGSLGGNMQAIHRIDSFDSDCLGNDESVRNEWYAKFRGSVLFYDHATLITLDDFTPQEIDKMLCDALNLIQVPHEIAQLVQDLSGGSFFWVKEIMHFLQEHGREEFLHAISVVEEDGHNHRRLSNASSMSVTSPRESFQGGLRFITQAMNYTRKSIVRHLSLTSPDKSSTAAKKVTKFKLELLVVCRFEKLTVEVQHVLRTASIIGVQFSTSLLYGVLPTYLQNDMQPFVDALLRQKWIHQDLEDGGMYMFTHPYAHKIIYDLTPSSERKNMHQIIADYIEHTSFDEPSQFALLSFHNAHCNTDKAFHYTFKAVTHLLENGTAYEIGQCVDLLYDALPLLVTVVDADVLQIMVYNVRKRINSLGEDHNSAKMTTRAAKAIVGGLFGAVNALSYRWHAPNSGIKKNAVAPVLSMIDEGVSGKSSRSVFSSRYEPSAGANIDGPVVLGNNTQSVSLPNSPSVKKTPSLKNAVRKVIDANSTASGLSSPPSSNASLSGAPVSNMIVSFFGGGGSSKKEARALGNSHRAKVYFQNRLKALDAMIEVKVSDFTAAGKFGEHKDWQHTLIMQTPKKELPMVASPAKFFIRAGSATKQLFAPFFASSVRSMASGGEQSSALNLSANGEAFSQVAEPANDQSHASAGNSVKLED